MKKKITGSKLSIHAHFTPTLYTCTEANHNIFSLLMYIKGVLNINKHLN